MQKNKIILLIDDDKEICALTKSVLEKTGHYDVIVSTQGRDGIALAKSHKPDLILLDIIMPDMDGTEVARILSENDSTKTVPIVFLTAIAVPAVFLAALIENEELKQRAGQVGGYYFIQKPITPNELSARIDAILNKK